MRSIPGTIAFALCIVCTCISAASGQSYPSRPVKMIVPYPAGGAGDIVARVVGQRLSETWKQQVVVENRTGGSGIIGTEAAARSAADGHTLLLTAPDTLAILPSLFIKLPYDWRRDFLAVGMVASMNMVLVVHPSLPVHDIRELIALAKQKPGHLTYASTGVGSYPYLNAEMFKSLAGVDILQVPYNGGQPGLTAVLAGEVSMFFVGESTAAPLIQSGRLRALGTTATRRSAILGNVSPIAESGLPDFDMDVWFGLFAPAGTPNEIIRKINLDWAKIAQGQEFRDAARARGFEAAFDTPAEFGTLVRNGQDRLAALIKSLGVQPQ